MSTYTTGFEYIKLVEVPSDQLRSNRAIKGDQNVVVYIERWFIISMEKLESSPDSTTTVEVNGRVITLTNEQLERVVKQQDNADNFSLFIAKIVEAGSACKITISKGDSKRPMVTMNVNSKQGECQIFGVLRVMRGKSGITAMSVQKDMLKQQFPLAQDCTE